MKLHVHLLLLLLVVVANLPTCFSFHLRMRPSHFLPAVREARREAYLKQPGGWRLVDPKYWRAKQLVEEAAKQANVSASTTVTIEAFYKVSQIRLQTPQCPRAKGGPKLHGIDFFHCKFNRAISCSSALRYE